MKKVTLNIAERLYALDMLQKAKTDHRTMAFIYQDIMHVGIDKDEATKINLRDIMGKDKETGEEKAVGTGWDNLNAEDKKIEFHDEVVDYLKKIMERKSKDGEVDFANDRPLVTLLEKLNN